MEVLERLPTAKDDEERTPALERAMLEEKLALAHSAQNVDELRLVLHDRLLEFEGEQPVERPGEDGALQEPYSPRAKIAVAGCLEQYAEYLEVILRGTGEEDDIETELAGAGANAA